MILLFNQALLFDAAVPPFAIAKSVPLQSPLLTVSLAAKSPATPKATLASAAEVTPVPPFAIATVPVLNVAPSIVITPALLLAIVVSLACPNSIAVNCGELPVPTPIDVRRVAPLSATIVEPLPTNKVLSAVELII